MTELEERWLKEMAALGLSRDAVRQLIAEEAQKLSEEEQRADQPRKPAAEAAIDTALTRSSVVTERMLRRLVAEEAQVRGIGAEGAHREFEEAAASGRLILLPNRTKAGEAVWTTKEVLDRERLMLLDAMERRGERDRIGAHRGGYIKGEAAEAVIARIAAAAAAEVDSSKRKDLTEQQRAAVRHAAFGDGVALIEGVAGAGKSFTLGAIKEAAEASGATVIGIAPSWKAADVVRRDAQLESARALQGFAKGLVSGRIRFGAAPASGAEKGVRYLGERVVIFVDEAGMAGAEDLSILLRQARRHNATVILSGDRKQLKSVEPGAAFAAIADALGVARMDEVRRQEIPWQREATRIFAAGDSVEALGRYDAQGRIAWASGRDAAIDELADDFMRGFLADPASTRAALAGRNADIHDINGAIRARMIAAGQLGEETMTVRTMHSGGYEGAGDPRDMEFRVNDRLVIGTLVGGEQDRKALNGDAGTVLGFRDGADPAVHLRLDRTGQSVWLKMAELVPPASKEEIEEAKRLGRKLEPRLPAIQHGWAMSVHKSQGQSIAYIHAFAGEGLSADLSYVSFSRHIKDIKAYVDAGGIAERLAENGVEVTGEAIKKAFFEAARLSEDGLNASDYIGNKAAWLRTGDAFATQDTAAAQVPTTAGTRMRMAAERVQDAILARSGQPQAGREAPRRADGKVDNLALLDGLRERQGAIVGNTDGFQQRHSRDGRTAAPGIQATAEAATRERRMVALSTAMQAVKDRLAPGKDARPGEMIRRAFERDMQRRTAAHTVRLAAHEQRISETVYRLRRPSAVVRAAWWVRAEAMKRSHAAKRARISRAQPRSVSEARMAVFNRSAGRDWREFSVRRQEAFVLATKDPRGTIAKTVQRMRSEAPTLKLPSEQDWIRAQAKSPAWLRRFGARDTAEATSMLSAADRGVAHRPAHTAAPASAVPPQPTKETAAAERPQARKPSLPTAYSWGQPMRVDAYAAQLADIVRRTDVEAIALLSNAGHKQADWPVIRENERGSTGPLADLARRSLAAEDTLLKVRGAMDLGRLSPSDEIRGTDPADRRRADLAILHAAQDRMPAGMDGAERAAHLARQAGLDGSDKKATDVITIYRRVAERLAGSAEAAAAAPKGSPARAYSDATAMLHRAIDDKVISGATMLAATGPNELEIVQERHTAQDRQRTAHTP